MTEVEGRRVALLARPGPACERLRDALDAAGAQRVLEADPTELESSQLSAAGAQVIVVALDAVTEDALDRFEEVLGDPAVDVIFEEAELAAAREGWDAARWQRHLVAKLRGHRDVLPPGPVMAAPADAGFESPGTAAASTGEQAPAPAPAAPAVFDTGHNPFDPVSAEFSGYESGDDRVARGDEFELAGMSEQELTAAADRNAELADEFVQAVAHADDDAGPDPLPEPSGSEPSGLGSFGELTLDDGSGGAHADTDEAASRFRHDMADLEQRISGLQLVDDTPAGGPERAQGAVLVMAGLGGPDAVRQLLGALPAGFTRPVLVQQRLDGGRYDKLVAQMQRATGLPVALAEAGQIAAAGTVYILSGDSGLDADDDGLRFTDAGGDLLAALPPADSAVLLLSGSDADAVDTIMNQHWSGALVAGQAADGCYDPAAANALAARGGDTGTPAELARRLAERWPADPS